MSMLGELAAQDGYDPNAIDWSRMNQPFGTLVDPNPVLHSAAGGLVQIRPSDVEAATAAALGASGGGLSTKAIARPRLTAAPEGGVYEPSQIRPNEKYFKTIDPAGGPGLEALVRFGDKTAHIQDVLVPGMPRETGRGAIGTSDMRDLLRQFREMHPDITTITGKRVSGASEGGGYSLMNEPRNVSLALPDAPPMGEILSPSAIKAKAKAEALHGKYPQYAEAYPATGPADLMAKMPDPKKPGKFTSKAFKEPVPYANWEEALARDAEPGFFLQKKLTPEAEVFAKDRNTIQKNMDRYGYEPYFDPAKRFDVDPANYGPFTDTGIAGQPKSAKSQAEWAGKYGTEDIRARLRAGFEEGKKVPDSERWYHMGQLEQEYIKHLGPKEGRAAFEREFADSMAATTGGANPYDNFLMSHYANYLNKRGESAAQRAYEMPTPIGGRFASGNMEQAQKYFEQGKGHWPADNSKRYDFSSAYLGNKNAGTIDEQMMSAFDPTLKDLQPKWYGPATGTMRQEAFKYGTDPRGFQDITWAGLKKLKTEAEGKVFDYEGPMINHINRSIETTHRLTGMPREEIVRRGLIRKEIPMYAGIGDEKTAAAVHGIRAYHSSPHDFDKFDLSKIGTGEGAQVYGHGLYFAENPAVSGQGGQYWQQFVNKFGPEERRAAELLQKNSFDRDKALLQARKEARFGIGDDPFKGFYEPPDYGKVSKLLESDKPVGPRTYEVNINADPAHMLDWDKPLREQAIAEKVAAAVPRDLRDIFEKNVASGVTGSNVYHNYLPRQSFAVRAHPGEHFSPSSATSIEDALASVGGDASRVRTILNPSKPAASDVLREAGIPGIKYLDEGSRISSPGQINLIRENIAQREALLKANPGNPTDLKWLAEYQDMLKRAENPTSNYVIFDPSKIDIMKKYAMPGMIGAGGLGALAAQDQYQP